MPLTRIIRVQAFLSYAGVTKVGGLFDDEQIRTSCPSCGKAQTFSEAPVRLEEGQTRYRCKNGCGDIAAIAEAESETVDWGYRLGDYVLNNAADVFVPVRGHLLIVPAAHKVARGHGGGQPSASK